MASSRIEDLQMLNSELDLKNKELAKSLNKLQTEIG